MLRLRSSVLTFLLSSPSASPIASLHHHLLSTAAAAPAVSPSPSFAVQEYLVETCGLTRAQALKASEKLSHLKSPSKPDAVLAFLAGLGLSRADVAAVVAKDPRFLCTGVERTLSPIVVGLTGLGLSRSEVTRLVSLAPYRLRCRSVISNLEYYLHIFGSYGNLLKVLKNHSDLLGSNLQKMVKPNVAFLRECGIGACDIAKMFIPVSSPLNTNPERFQATVACVERLGVPRRSGMFRHMLHVVAFVSEEKITLKMEYLKKSFRWSDAEVGVAVCKAPMLLVASKDKLQNKSEFLFSEVRLEPAYIARRPIMLMYSLEGRIRPRYYVLKFLKEKGLLRQDRDYYGALIISEKVFMEKFICPHKEAAPHLAEDYATAHRGEVPSRFKFT